MFNLEWIVIRFSSLFTLFGVIIDSEIVFFIIGFLLVHISLGVSSILHDYIHIKKIKYFFIFLVKVLSMEIVKNIMEFFF
uniref:succinate dehydrogenase subunit 4 n=1 Tax=Hypnea nidulans TaxID=673449 RepID=UPI003001F549|nr:succinate dehydrogenase subunit 4 [Hypnea nidulans]